MTTSNLAESLGLKQDPEPLFFLAEAGYLWLDLGHDEQARTIFEALITLCPSEPAGYLGLGEAHLATGRHREAVSAFKRATQAPCVLVETLAFAYRKLGDASLMADNLPAARRAWGQASEVHPDGVDAELARNRTRCLEEGLTLSEAEGFLTSTAAGGR